MAQSKSLLEERRKKLLQEIESKTQELEQTRKDRAQILNSFHSLQNNIGKRQEVMSTLSKEVQNAQQVIEKSIDEVDALQNEIRKLQIEYTNILHKAYKLHLGMSDFLFIFSSSSINQAFKRWQYLKQIKRFREKQSNVIMAKQELLIQKIQLLENNKVNRKNLLDLEQQQNALLTDELKQKDIIIKNLRQDETRLKTEISKQKETQRKLDTEIEKLIATEIARKRKEATERALKAKSSKKSDASIKKPKGSTKTPKISGPLEITETPESTILSENFESNKGRLPWPVQRGSVCKGFGVQPHPILPKLTITNNGIDILTDQNIEVRSVGMGVVLGIKFVANYKNVILIQHGRYFSVYANLEVVFVEKGQKIDFGKPLGTVGIQNESNRPELHFEIWKDDQKVNPLHWLKKK